MRRFLGLLILIAGCCCVRVDAGDLSPLTLARVGHWLEVRGAHLPEGVLRINYLEAYCRGGSTTADWVQHTVIPHTSQLISAKADGSELRLRDTLADGVTVDHRIIAHKDCVEFQLTAHNPSDTRSEAEWAQACPRLAAFTGFDASGPDLDDYLPKCFLFLEGSLVRMPTPTWAKKARYVPGQVWCPTHVSRDDVNPRPLSPLVPSNGLIGCFSSDESLIFATAWEPYQELFQGVARCLHADFRLGGLAPGAHQHIRGMIYLVPADIDSLLHRYANDFPEHVTAAAN